jgi:hypothetical protein
MGEVLDLLLPRPQRVVASAAGPRIARTSPLIVACAQSSAAEARGFGARVADLGLRVELAGGARATREDAHVRVAIDGTALSHPRAGSYRLTATERGVDVLAFDRAGVAYGLATLEQFLRAAAPADARAPLELPGCRIDDWPDFATRGLLVDVSRTKVPTLATLFELVDLAAHLKLNELQLYTEHTFAYRGHEIVWRDASPITPDDVAALDRRCRERHIELVPNQQSLGHMHRWLAHDRYRALAEVPEGIEHAFSRQREPYGLAPTDAKSLALLEGLYDQLLSVHTSRTLNANLDEPVDLGLGRSKAACEECGKARVYLEFVRAVHQLVAARGRRMQMWGDFVVRHRELARELPRDAILLDWGYEADHPFAAEAQLFAASGLEFRVCPGTSSWQSIAGRTTNALANMRNAAENGLAAGASGLLVTDWGDRGHLQPSCASYLGIAAASSFAWNAAGSAREHEGWARERDGWAREREGWGRALDVHVFRDRGASLGRAAVELGDAYLETASPSTNGSALFFLLAFAEEPLPHARMPDLAPDGLARALEYVEARRACLDDIAPTSGEARRSQLELRWAADVLSFACRFGSARLRTPPGAPVTAIPERERVALARELEPLVLEHRSLWLARNRPGGLDESASWLERVVTALRARG